MQKEREGDYLTKRAGDLAEKNIVSADEEIIVTDAAKIMRDKSISSILVTKSSQPVGIVTERDIIYRAVANNNNNEPFKTTLKDIMSTPLITIDESNAVKDAIIRMRKNNIRRIPVVAKDGKIVGMLTLKSIIGNSAQSIVELPEVDLSSKQIMCPYCGSKFEDKQALSTHIDRLHLGSGLLEGDLRQW
jgi:CBS domain-containing protein